MSDIDDLFGRRCGDYDPDCATCFAYKQQDEIEKLRAERDECERQLQDSFSKMGEILEERNVLRAALKPFLIEHRPEHNVYGYKMVFVTPDDLRAAAAALKETDDV